MKIEEHVLSIEQMKHLQELGVDTSDASMAWYMSPKKNQWKIKVKDKFAHEMLRRISPERYIPTYTTGDLIEKLPKNIDKKTFTMSYLSAPSVGYSLSKHVMIPSQQNGLVDALYSILCWVAENHKELLEVRND